VSSHLISGQSVICIGTNVRCRVDEALKIDTSGNEPLTETKIHHEDPSGKDADATNNVRLGLLPKRTSHSSGLLGLIAY
jgi:hypothetical protein